MPDRISTPEEVGLPPKFSNWRSQQAQALNVMITNQKRITAVCAPTGFGKSPVVVAAALMSKVPTCIVTATRGLQSQYLTDFESVGMVSIMGKKNYACSLKEEYTCEDGQVARCPFNGSVACPLSQAEMRAATSNLVVTNYAKWTSARKYGQGMNHFQQVIFDEGHSAPGALASAMQIVLHPKEICETLGMEFPSPEAAKEFPNWRFWAVKARLTAETEMLRARARITGTNPRVSWVKHYTHMRNLYKRLTTLSTASMRDWLVDATDDGYQFDPIRPGRYVEVALLVHVPKVIMVSATLRPKTMYMLGIAKDKFEFAEFDSEFDPRRCPIYYVPTMRVDKNQTDLSMLWLFLDQIAARRRDRNGLVHTVSYARRDEILASSRFASSMLVNPKGEPPARMITQFIDQYPGAILVSPSVGTGYDFSYKAAEWGFMAKIPFPDSRSKIVRARQEDDKEYGPYVALQDMIQCFGRIMRDKKDQGENFIGDMHLDWFYPKYKHLAPRSFHGVFRQVNTIPPPPPRLV